MKLYPRQLDGVAELRKEKHRLLQLRTEQEKGGLDLNPLSGLFAPGKNSRKKSAGQKTAPGKEEKASFDLLSLAGNLLSSGDMMQIVVDLGLPLLGAGFRKIRINFLEKAAKEFFGGYIRWKALSIGFRLVRSMLDDQKNKTKTKKANS